MAVSLTLTDGTTTYNLLTGVLKLRYQDWDMSGPLGEGETTLQGYGAAYKFSGYQPITETFQLYAPAAATELSIRQAVANIDKILEQARRWHTNSGTEGLSGAVPVIAFQTSAEASRKSLLYGGSITMLSGPGAQPTLSNNNAAAVLTLTRHPLWMDASTATLQATTTVSTCGGKSAVLTQAGTAPALLNVQLGVPGIGPVLTRAWLGILSTGLIDRQWFNPVLEFNNSTSGTDATFKADPAGNDMGGNTIEVTFATHADLHSRAVVGLSDIDATAAHWVSWRGVYRVLCRCRVSAGTVGLQLRWGGSGTLAANFQSGTEEVIAHTTYKFVDLGEVTIPVGRSLLSCDVLFQVWAERLSGAGNLYLDALVLLPAEHMATLANAYIIATVGNVKSAWVVNDYNDSTYAYTTDENNLVVSVPDLAPRDFFMPCYTGGVFVVVAERDTGSTATDTIDLTITSYARWAHYRDS